MAFLLILALFIGLSGLSGCIDQRPDNTTQITKIEQPSNADNSSTNQSASNDYITYNGAKYTIVEWNHSKPCPYCGVLDRNMVAQVEHKGYLFYLIHCNNCRKNYAT